jgi:hypothetical protein
MITKLSREVVCAGCEEEDEAAGAEVFETVCGAGCETRRGTSCASAEAEISSVNAVVARRSERVRMVQPSEKIAVWLQCWLARRNAQ